MKKKIISIGIIGMFLLTSLAGLSAAGLGTEISEKSSVSMSSDDGLGDIVIYVWIRHNHFRNGPLFNIWIKDAKVTATSLDDGMVYEMEYSEEKTPDGYWLEDVPVGNYLFEGKRGLRRGSTTEKISDAGLRFGDIDLKFIKNMRTCSEFSTNPVIYLFYQFLARLLLI